MVYKEYNGIKLSHLDPLQTAKEVAQHGIVVIRQSGATPQDFADWSLDFGYHLSPEIWCTEKEFHGLFNRVTNQLLDGVNQGLAADHELDWHSNITPVLDGEELVGLFARTITYPTETWFCNTIPYWQQLPSQSQKRYRNLKVVLDPDRRLGRVNPGWSLNIKEIYTQKVIDDLVKNRRSRDIAKAINMEPENRNKFKNSRGILEQARFVPDHPLKTEGLFFSPFEIHGFYEDGAKCADSDEIFWTLWKDLIQSEKYIYKHSWATGDIILMDQILTIHRRPSIDKEKPRELLRAACWYKSRVRTHFDYVL